MEGPQTVVACAGKTAVQAVEGGSTPCSYHSSCDIKQSVT